MDLDEATTQCPHKQCPPPTHTQTTPPQPPYHVPSCPVHWPPYAVLHLLLLPTALPSQPPALLGHQASTQPCLQHTMNTRTRRFESSSVCLTGAHCLNVQMHTHAQLMQSVPLFAAALHPAPLPWPSLCPLPFPIPPYHLAYRPAAPPAAAGCHPVRPPPPPPRPCLTPHGVVPCPRKDSSKVRSHSDHPPCCFPALPHHAFVLSLCPSPSMHPIPPHRLSRPPHPQLWQGVISPIPSSLPCTWPYT